MNERQSSVNHTVFPPPIYNFLEYANEYGVEKTVQIVEQEEEDHPSHYSLVMDTKHMGLTFLIPKLMQQMILHQKTAWN